MSCFREADIRALWEKEQATYHEFGDSIKSQMRDILKEIGITAELSYRIKDTESLIKKLYRKDKTYEEIHDKVGARAIVQFCEQLKVADEKICEHFGQLIDKKENKATTLSEHEFGYQSIHYDITNKDKTLFCEFQLRTICQHNWSMMSHSLSYKKDNIPTEVKRQINALSALFEVADNQFQIIRDLIKELPDNHEISILQWLEEQYYSIFSTKYDYEMTQKIMDHLKYFYSEENIIEQLSTFYSSNREKFISICRDRNDNVFYSQPEIFIILERLSNKKILLKTKWTDIYPIECLESIANVWGTSID